MTESEMTPVQAWYYFADFAGEFVPPEPASATLLVDTWHRMFTAIARHYGASPQAAEAVWEWVWPQVHWWRRTKTSCDAIIALIFAHVGYGPQGIEIEV